MDFRKMVLQAKRMNFEVRTDCRIEGCRYLIVERLICLDGADKAALATVLKRIKQTATKDGLPN